MTRLWPSAAYRAPRHGALLSTLALAALLGACGASPPPALQGYVEADFIYVGPATTGTLARLAVEPGQRVAAGQALFAMDDTPEARAAEAAGAQRERAQAQLANLRTGRRPLELEMLQQQLQQAQAALSASGSALKRQAELVDQGFVSAARRDEMQASRDRDAARVQELQAQLALARLAARSDEVEAAAATVRAAAADAAQAGWRQAQTLRAAPRAGQVFDVLHRAGEVVTAGSPVVSLLPDGATKVLFFVPQAGLAQATPGRLVQVSCDGCPSALQARIRWVSPQAEYTPPVLYGQEARAKLVFRVEAEPLPGTDLRPGQPVDVRLTPAGPT